MQLSAGGASSRSRGVLIKPDKRGSGCQRAHGADLSPVRRRIKRGTACRGSSSIGALYWCSWRDSERALGKKSGGVNASDDCVNLGDGTLFAGPGATSEGCGKGSRMCGGLIFTQASYCSVGSANL